MSRRGTLSFGENNIADIILKIYRERLADYRQENLEESILQIIIIILIVLMLNLQDLTDNV